LHHALFAVCIQAGGGFIQQQQLTRVEQGAGNGNALRLSDRSRPPDRLLVYLHPAAAAVKTH
jgi:hypothetical protein